MVPNDINRLLNESNSDDSSATFYVSKLQFAFIIIIIILLIFGISYFYAENSRLENQLKQTVYNSST